MSSSWLNVSLSSPQKKKAQHSEYTPTALATTPGAEIWSPAAKSAQPRRGDSRPSSRRRTGATEPDFAACVDDQRKAHQGKPRLSCAFRECIIPGMKVGEILRRLAEDGWVLVATRGSHRQFKHAVKPGRVTVPGKPSDELAPGTLNNIRKQAGFKQ